jgi:hypothetical protein
MSDEFSPCFSESCPALKDTFSGRAFPCPFPEGTDACPYSRDCYREAERDGDQKQKDGNLRAILSSSYQAPIHITLAEPSGSFVIRSEHHFHGREMFRMSLRRHLYEVVHAACPPPDPPAPPPAYRCPELRPDTRLGQYIGYVDLRRHYKTAPLALGVLAVPRKLGIDPDSHVIHGNYSPLVGGPAFPCTVYSRQDATAGAACAQACIIMLLGMLADRGAVLEGSYTLTQLGYQFLPPTGAELPAGSVPDGRVERSFPSRGLSPSRIVGVLRWLGINAEVARLEPRVHSAESRGMVERLAQRIIECYIQARYPVILGVDPIYLAQLPDAANAPPGPEAGWGVRQEIQPDAPAHAVTVVGIRKASLQERPPHLVIHDPARQPFLERPVSFVFEACRRNPTDDGDRRILMILPTEASVRCSLIACLDQLREENNVLFETFLGRKGAEPDAPHDCQFSLLYPKDVHTFLWPIPLGGKERADLDAQFEFQSRRYWCIAGYRNGRLLGAWFYPSDEDRPRLAMILHVAPLPPHKRPAGTTAEKPARRFLLDRPGRAVVELALPQRLIDVNP